MNNLIEALKQFVKEHKNEEERYRCWFNGASLYVEMRIPYKQAEFIVETIESLRQSCDELIKHNEMLTDYTRLLRNENETLKS